MRVNYHIHSNYSADAVPTIRENCLKASELGFDEICITNHQEWPDMYNGDKRYYLSDSEWKHAIGEIGHCRKEFPGLAIKLGVELGYMEGKEGEILRFLEKYPFDYVLGSVHCINGRFISEYRDGIHSMYRNYYSLLKKMLSAGYCDCVGHFDIVKKFTELQDPSLYIEDVRECISIMKNKGIGFELNAMGWSHRNRECYPSPLILKMLHESGIRKATIGSDCHELSEFDYRIDEGLKILRETGFREICTFTQRKPFYHKL
jgi:histidinol-phosphatase (PHP family)